MPIKKKIKEALTSISDLRSGKAVSGRKYSSYPSVQNGLFLQVKEFKYNICNLIYKRYVPYPEWCTYVKTGGIFLISVAFSLIYAIKGKQNYY